MHTQRKIETTEQWQAFCGDGMAIRPSALEHADESDLAVIRALNELGDTIEGAAHLFHPEQPVARLQIIEQVNSQLEALYTSEHDRFEPIRMKLLAGDSMRFADRRHRSPRILYFEALPDDPTVREIDYFYLLAAREASNALWGQFVTTDHAPRELTEVWLWIEHSVQHARNLYARAQQARGIDDAPAPIPFKPENEP